MTYISLQYCRLLAPGGGSNKPIQPVGTVSAALLQYLLGSTNHDVAPPPRGRFLLINNARINKITTIV